MRPERLSAAILVAVLVCAACSSEQVVQKSDLPIRDDFSHGCNWAVDDDGVSKTGCTHGVYEVLVRKPDVRPHHLIPRRFDPTSGVTVSADVSLARYAGRGSESFAIMGLGCWSSPHGAPAVGYLFDFAMDGSAAIFRQDERHPQEHFMKLLKNAGPVDGFDPAVPTRVSASCRPDGGTMLLELRMGRRTLRAVDAVRPSRFQAAGFDVLTDVPGTAVDFDNALITAAGRA